MTRAVPARCGRRAHGVDATGPAATTTTSSAWGSARGSRTSPWTVFPAASSASNAARGGLVTRADWRARRRLATAWRTSERDASSTSRHSPWYKTTATRRLSTGAYSTRSLSPSASEIASTLNVRRPKARKPTACRLRRRTTSSSNDWRRRRTVVSFTLAGSRASRVITSRSDASDASISGSSTRPSGSVRWAAWTVSIHQSARAGRLLALARATPSATTSLARPPAAARSSIDPSVAW